MRFHSGYLAACIERLDRITSDIWGNFDRVPTLPPEQSQAVVAEFLQLAGGCQNLANIEIGRYALRQIPRDWLIEHVEPIARSALNLDDEWEFRRLSEVYQQLDAGLLRRLLETGSRHPNPAIREAAQEWLV